MVMIMKFTHLWLYVTEHSDRLNEARAKVNGNQLINSAGINLRFVSAFLANPGTKLTQCENAQPCPRKSKP